MKIEVQMDSLESKQLVINHLLGLFPNMAVTSVRFDSYGNGSLTAELIDDVPADADIRGVQTVD